MDIERLETVLRDCLSPARDIIAAYLFGSRARGTATAASDVDIAILYAADPPPTLEGLGLDTEAEIERALGLPVQVVVLNRAPVDLIHRIFRDGKLIVDRDPARRIRFEVKARNEFFDLQPVLARYRAVRAPAR